MAKQSRSHMNHKFSEVPDVKIPRSSFDRSHGIKTTFNAGFLVPILVDEALPGDSFNCRLSAFARLATPIKPLMDSLYMDTFFFAVPYRLVWDNFQKFNGEQTNPGDSTDYLIPQFQSYGPAVNQAGTLQDYMGVPILTSTLPYSCLWSRAYALIYNEWFRDENLQNSITVPTDDGPDLVTDYNLRRRGKRHDYFTSCLPWPQKGDAVTLPLGTSAPVISTGNGIPTFDGGGANNIQMYVGDSSGREGTVEFGNPPTNPVTTPTEAIFWNNPKLETDLSAATAATVNDIRLAFQTQKLLERDARGGTRYTEIIRSHFGVVSPDARLQRPEYLGGGSARINISPIAQTSQSDTSPQANLSGVGTVALHNHGFTKSFTEHTLIIGLVNVRADLTYQQGINRMFHRSTRYDFYWPAFAHLGEEPVLSKEIYMDGSASDEDVFGYQERWSSYRYKPSLVTGRFRSTATTPLDVWHLAQEFDNRPLLNSDFIVDDPPIDRVIAVPSEPHFLFDGHFEYRCARPMPLYSVPGLIDHF